jgi:hypothetical protein
MQIFPKTPAAKLSAMRAELDKMNARRAAADAAVIDLRMAAVKLAREGANDAALDAAELAVERAKARVENLAAAHAGLTTDIVALEKEIAEQATQKLHDEDAAEKEANQEEWIDDGEDAIAAVKKWAESSEKLSFVPECRPLTDLLKELVTNSWPPAIAVINREAINLTRAVKERRMPVRVAAPVIVETPVPEVVIVRVFTKDNIKYRDPRHPERLELKPRYVLCDVSAAQSEVGIKAGWVIPEKDPQVSELRRKGHHTDQRPAEHLCKSLDPELVPIEAPLPATTDPVIAGANFTPMNRGGPRQFVIPVEPVDAPKQLAAGGTRKADVQTEKSDD